MRETIHPQVPSSLHLDRLNLAQNAIAGNARALRRAPSGHVRVEQKCVDDLGFYRANDLGEASENTEVSSAATLTGTYVDTVVAEHRRHRTQRRQRNDAAGQTASAHRPDQPVQVQRHAADVQVRDDVQKVDVLMIQNHSDVGSAARNK